jgi:hypothetical protein
MYDFVSINQFSIRPNNYQEYLRDGASKKVESRLNDLMVVLINEAFREREDKRRRELEAERRAKAAARREEIQKLRKVLAIAEGHLLKAAEELARAQDLRVLIMAVEADRRLQDVEKRAAWLTWARAKADDLDPLGASPERLLDVDFDAFARLHELEDEGDC